MVRALELARDLGAREVHLLLDSKLIVEQLSGRWRVKDAKLIPLWSAARKTLGGLRALDRRARAARPELGRRRAGQRGDRPGAGRRAGLGRPPAVIAAATGELPAARNRRPRRIVRRPSRTPIGQVALIVLAALLAAACGGSAASASPSGAAHPPTLAGTNWGVVSVAGRASVAGQHPVHQLHGGSRRRAPAGCNSFGGDFTYDPATGTLRFGELGMTLMLCMGPQRRLRDRLLRGAAGSRSRSPSDHRATCSSTGLRAGIVRRALAASRGYRRRVGWPRSARRSDGCASASGATRRGVRKVRAPQRRVAGNARPP